MADTETIKDRLKRAEQAATYMVNGIKRAQMERRTEGEASVRMIARAIANGYAALSILRGINEDIQRHEYLERLREEDEPKAAEHHAEQAGEGDGK